MIQLRYFAHLREALGTDGELLELPDGVTTIAQLTAWLQRRGGSWEETLADPRLHTALNQSIAWPEAPVCDGDEIAWFPPVTGG